MNFLLRVLYLVLLLHGSLGVIYHLNDSEYERMPPVYKIDDYDSCFQKLNDVYCTLVFELVSDEPNELLHMIEEYSEHTQTHFDHSKLTYGVCVTQNCQHYIQDKPSVSKEALEKCLNQSFWESYGLKTRLQHYACYNSSDNKYKMDTSDMIAGTIVLVIIVVNILGTLYDVCCTSNKCDGKSILLSFSIRRNWKRLMSTKPCLEPRLQSLNGLNGIRCVMVYGVVSVHCIFAYIIVGKNIHEVELAYNDLFLRFLLNATLMMQTFFVISGFLLVYKMELLSKKEQIDWKIVPKAILNRYLRLTPAYGFILLMLATWLRFVGPGPVWATTGNLIAEDCQKRWWMNLLYINNYVDNYMCQPTSWSLATDMQLFCFGLIMCMLLRTRNMRFRKVVLISLIVFGMIIVAIHSYVLDLKAILSFAPRVSSKIFGNDIDFNQTYKMGHSNACSYIIGMGLGYLVYSWQQKKKDLKKYPLLRYIYWAVVPLLIGIILSGSIFSRYAPRDPLYIRVTYATFVKPIVGLFTAILIAGTIFKWENVYRKFFERDLWIIPSRLTYCVYLVHLPYLVLYINTRTSLIYYSTFSIISLSILLTIVSFITAVPMYLFIEAPFTEISKYLIEPTKKPKKEIVNANNSHKKIE